ncbi:helix-turn-helix domain-containing protein [Kitasatospora sp. GP82]|uniref:PucR family transcriptional regulator n=1 Tax=Kitasatospora sp. GP82 TaxID=3035089 RepID=UPI00247386EC|nr:helix-turn-helix domain-containing protein [Kitasatospora sp. GP82]MDH6124829.1 hypothetical protein [Kitasatospora sp. GP82]
MDDAVPLAMTASPPHAVPPTAGVAHTLLRHTTAMFEGVDEFAVLGAARAAMAALGPFDAAHLLHNGLPVRCAPFTPAVSGARPHTAATATGHPDGAGGCWMRVYALRDGDRCLGYLVVRARTAPSADETALADLLVRQARIALAWMARRRLERATAADHDRLRTAEVRRDADPSATVAVLERTAAGHEALARAAASGRGEEGIVRALHELTGLPALTEDLFGNLRVWAGPGQPPPPRGPDLGPREELLQRARHQPGAVRDRDRLIAPIAMAGDLLGLVALVDPDRRAGKPDTSALDQAGLVLAPELFHARRLALLEPQLRRDLVDRLISGRATEDMFACAATFGHDLHRPHRVAVLQWPGPADQAALGDAVARAAARLRLDVLIGARRETTVVLAVGLDSGDALYRAVSDDLNTRAGAIGVGGRCDSPADLPHSYDEAARALTVRRRSHDPHGSTNFEELGLYRMMGTGDGEREADRFVHEWLGALLDYDARHHTDLVTTLSRYLESGGSYDATSEILLIHRSTVRYRLQRIREITGHDLSDVEARLNLHVATRIRNVFYEPR